VGNTGRAEFRSGLPARAKPMRSQIMFDVPAGLSIDEVKRSTAPFGGHRARPQAQHMRFQPDCAHDEPGPDSAGQLSPSAPIGRSASQTFDPQAQSF
jgi:serine/threonine-protein kinase